MGWRKTVLSMLDSMGVLLDLEKHVREFVIFLWVCNDSAYVWFSFAM